MISNPKQIESIILDFRYFLDEALTFVEFFESGERDITRLFFTNSGEISRLRGYAIEYTRLALDLKKTLLNGFDQDEQLQESASFGEFNTGLVFTEQFKVKRLHFFTVLFSRLDELYKRLEEFNNDHDANELIKVYFKLLKKLATKSNEFIGYLESDRWHRDIALQVLDRLVALANDFICVFEKFVQYLEENNRVRKSDESREKKAKQLYSKTRLMYKKLSTSKFCLCVYLLIMILAFYLLKYYFWVDSSDDLIKEKEKSFNDHIEIQNYIDSYVNNFFEDDEVDEDNDRPKRKPTDLVDVDEKNLYSWTKIVNYMKQLNFIVFSFTAYIYCEWISNR